MFSGIRILSTCGFVFCFSTVEDYFDPDSAVGGQPRILMAMARDGLLPSFFSSVHPKTSVPVNGTVLAGLVAAVMAFMMDVDQLSGMVRINLILGGKMWMRLLESRLFIDP